MDQHSSRLYPTKGACESRENMSPPLRSHFRMLKNKNGIFNIVHHLRQLLHNISDVTFETHLNPSGSRFLCVDAACWTWNSIRIHRCHLKQTTSAASSSSGASDRSVILKRKRQTWIKQSKSDLKNTKICMQHYHWVWNSPLIHMWRVQRESECRIDTLQVNYDCSGTLQEQIWGLVQWTEVDWAQYYPWLMRPMLVFFKWTRGAALESGERPKTLIPLNGL